MLVGARCDVNVCVLLYRSNELSADERQCSHGIVRAFGASHVSVLWLGAPSGMFDTSVVVAGNDSSDEKKSDSSIDVVKPSLTSHDDKEAMINVVGDAATSAVESTPSTSTDATQWPETDVLSLDQVLVVEPPCSAYNFPVILHYYYYYYYRLLLMITIFIFLFRLLLKYVFVGNVCCTSQIRSPIVFCHKYENESNCVVARWH